MLQIGKLTSAETLSHYSAIKVTMIEMAHGYSRGENGVTKDWKMASAAASLAASMDSEDDEKPCEGHLVLSRILMNLCQDVPDSDKEKCVPYILKRLDIGKLERLRGMDVAFNVGLIFDYLSRNALKKSMEGRGLYDGLAFQYYKLANKLWPANHKHKNAVQKNLAAVEERLRLAEMPSRNANRGKLTYRKTFDCI
jgi:hypothetical protein